MTNIDTYTIVHQKPVGVVRQNKMRKNFAIFHKAKFM